MIDTITWKRPPQGAPIWMAEISFMRLSVRPARAPRRGKFAAFINGQRVGIWDTPETAMAHVERLAALHVEERAA